MSRNWRRALVIAAALVAFAELGAQRPAPAAMFLPTSPDSVRVYLMTVGQGDGVEELFGHNGLWVHHLSGGDTVYNWGVYDFNSPGFIGKFLLGDMRYTMDDWPIDATILHYQSRNRQVWAQRLNLTPTETTELLAFLRWNMQPENRVYSYDYYRDNCSTRARDALDRVLKGAVSAHLKAIPTDETYRGHSLRLMRHNFLVSGVQMALGRPTDVVLTAQETSFLPVQLMNHLRTLKLDAGTRPLLGETFVVNQATRPDEPTAIPALWKGMLPVGLVLAALILLPGFAIGGGEPHLRVQATMVAIVAGFFGVIGTILFLLVTVTTHVAAHGNENMFMLNPLWLILAVILPRVIVRGHGGRFTRGVLVAAQAIAVCAVIMHLVGLSKQPNWDVIALVLPAELAIAFVASYRMAGFAAFDRVNLSGINKSPA
jgi:hypothetical protein